MEPPETCDFKMSNKPEQPALEPPEVILDREEEERRAAADGSRGNGNDSGNGNRDRDADDDPEERTRLTRSRRSQQRQQRRRSSASDADNDSSHGNGSFVLEGMEESAPVRSSTSSSLAAAAAAASKSSVQKLYVIPRRDVGRGQTNSAASAAGGTDDSDYNFHSRTSSNDGGDTLGLGSMIHGHTNVNDNHTYGGEAATVASNLGDMSGALIVVSGAREASFENLNFKEDQNKHQKKKSDSKQIGNDGQPQPEEPEKSQSLVVYQQTESQSPSQQTGISRNTPPSRSARQRRHKLAAANFSGSNTSGTSGAGASHLSGHSAALSASSHSIRTISPPGLRSSAPSNVITSRERLLDRKNGKLESFLTKRTSCGTDLSEASRDRRHRGAESGGGNGDLNVNGNLKGAYEEIAGATRRRTGRSTSRVRHRSVGPKAASAIANSSPEARARSKSRPRLRSIKSNGVQPDSTTATPEAPPADHPDRIRKEGAAKTKLHRSVSSPVQETNYTVRRLSPPSSKLASAPSSGNQGRGNCHDISAEMGHHKTYSRTSTTASSDSSRESSSVLRNSCLSINHPPPPPPPLKKSGMKSTRSSVDDLSNSQVHNNDNNNIGLASKHKEYKDAEVAVAAAPSLKQSPKMQTPTASTSTSARTKLEDPSNPADGSEATGGTESTYPSTSYERGNGSGGYGDSGMGSAMMDYRGNNCNHEAVTPRGIRESNSNVSGSGNVRDRNNIGVRQFSERSTPPPPPPSAAPGPPTSTRSYRQDDSNNKDMSRGQGQGQGPPHRHPPPPSTTANPAANPSAQTKDKQKAFHFEDLSESRLSEARRRGVGVSHGRGASKTVCDDLGRESGTGGRIAARTSDRYSRSASAARMRRAQSAGRRRASVDDDIEWQRQQANGYRQIGGGDGRDRNREMDWDRDRDRDRDRARNRGNGGRYQSVSSFSRSKDQLHPPPPQQQYQRGPSRSRASSRPRQRSPPPAPPRARSPEPRKSRTPSRHQRDYGHDDSCRFNDRRYDDRSYHEDRSYHDRDRHYHPPPPQDRRYHHDDGMKNGSIHNNHHNYPPPNNPHAGKEIPKRDLLRHPSMHDDQPTPGANEINLVIDEHGHGSFTCSNKQFDIQIVESTRRYVIRTQMGKLSKIREIHPQTNILRTLSYWNDLQKKRYSRDGHGIGGQLAIDSQNKNQVIMTLMGEYSRAQWEYDERFQRELERFVEDALQFHMCLNGETEEDVANGKGKKKASRKKKGGDGVLSKVFQKAINRENK